MVINNEITLDISKQTQFVKISLPQGDNIDRVFKINLVNGVDVYTIPATATVRFEMTRPDGSFIYNNCPVEDNQVILEITPAISAVDGRFPAQFRITDSSTGGLIKSFRFHILIHESVDIENAVVNTSEFTALQDMELRVGDIAPAIQAAETATDNANNAADSANDIVNQLEVETLIIWKPYVSTYADIATTYPTPELGWTTQAQDTGIRWRYNGVAWINIGVSTDDKVGDLSTVTTTNKTNVVSAINEVNSQLAETTNIANKAVKKVNGTLPDANGNVEITIPTPDLTLYATKTDLNSKADKTITNNLQIQITNMGNGSPKGTYPTLSALQSAFPTGATGIYVVTADGEWYYWSGSAWTAGGIYQATGSDGTFTIKDGVTQYKASLNILNGYLTLNYEEVV